MIHTNMVFKRELPTPAELKERYPLSKSFAQLKARRDDEIKSILLGKDNRMLLIIGPCSADREDAVLEYMKRLRSIQDKVKDVIFIVPRLYSNKPRTIGVGYKGILHQPDPDRESDLLKGIITVRHMNVRVIEETGLTCADEMLYPDTYYYLSDLLSYIAVGARSVENQMHRMTASGLAVPVGMKNPTSGNLTVMLNSIIAAQAGQNFIYRNWEVETSGNPFVHAILRGYESKFGRSIPNYHYEDLQLLLSLYNEKNISNPACIVDCNHANSDKHCLDQIRIAKDVLQSRKHSDGIHSFVKGLMIESYLEDGSQSPHERVYGKSITDPCLGWDKTETLIMDLAHLWE
ncbi:MAG: 3-deoxy-7-phosphoheptulonate synthase [Oscillospiraceae bacterium]|nr:3-deoxy-7-phosphoheptulonate synthase [Oscillospiraceae bacterium]